MTPPVEASPMDALQRVALRATGRAEIAALEPIRPTPFERRGDADETGGGEETTEERPAAPPLPLQVQSPSVPQTFPSIATIVSSPSPVPFARPHATQDKGGRLAAAHPQHAARDLRPAAAKVEELPTLRVIPDNPQRDRELAQVSPRSREEAPRPTASVQAPLPEAGLNSKGAIVAPTAKPQRPETVAELRPRSVQPQLPVGPVELARSEPARIEISIGRMEVRTAAPPPRLASAPPQLQPSSLDRYLGRRNQGSRS
jgi:hypothetical protein